MDLTTILINTIAGGGGGFLGNRLKKNGLGLLGNILAGAIGGNALPAILSAAGMFGGGGANDLIFSIISALVGGAGGSLLGGLFK